PMMQQFINEFEERVKEVVEYSIRDGMVEIYRKITSHHYPCEKLRQEIREIWINSHYRKIFKTTANWETAKRMAVQLVEEAVNHAIIQYATWLHFECKCLCINIRIFRIRG
ncbi:hypothetical protein QUF54_09125, partial [Candidatus Marithioploca araucensis]|nr:hypothetical protein [Candidatus Marithioploca araucensis]